jgi:hypothetical protein
MVGHDQVTTVEADADRRLAAGIERRALHMGQPSGTAVDPEDRDGVRPLVDGEQPLAIRAQSDLLVARERPDRHVPDVRRARATGRELAHVDRVELPIRSVLERKHAVVASLRTVRLDARPPDSGILVGAAVFAAPAPER